MHVAISSSITLSMFSMLRIPRCQGFSLFSLNAALTDTPRLRAFLLSVVLFQRHIFPQLLQTWSLSETMNHIVTSDLDHTFGGVGGVFKVVIQYYPR